MGVLMKDRKVLSRKGFTLVEILMAVVLLVIGVTAVVKTVSSAMTVSIYVDAQTVALMLAEEKMEDTKNTVYSLIASSNEGALAGDFAAFRRSVTVSGTPKQVTVDVAWTYKVGGSQGTTQTVSLVTIIADTFS
jgi:type II secretion system protein I